MSKKTFWLIVGAAIIVALVWVGVKHMRNSAPVVTDEVVTEEVVESVEGAEIPAPAVDM